MLQLAPQHARAAAAAGAGECVRMPAGYWIIVCFLSFIMVVIVIYIDSESDASTW